MADPAKVITCMIEADILKKKYKEFVPEDSSRLGTMLENIFKREDP